MSAKEKHTNPPDHRLKTAEIPDATDEPVVTAIVNFKAYIKPPMEEELSAGGGGGATESGTRMICRCVPVQQCVCDAVLHYHESDPCPNNNCSCHIQLVTRLGMSILSLKS